MNSRAAIDRINLLFAKGVITPEELFVKMPEVEKRLTSSRA
jgi:hypothetical protein